MPLLDDYLSEDELVAELKAKIGIGTKRTTRTWRRQRKGPPWAIVGRRIVYPTADFKEWLAAQVQQPVRSRRASKQTGTAGDVMQVAEEKLKQLGAAVAAGEIDRARVVKRLAQIARDTGLVEAAA
jgi:hypothetical protein